MADYKQDQVPNIEQQEEKDQAMVVTDVAEPIQPKTIPPPPPPAVEKEPLPVPETEEEPPLKPTNIASENDHHIPQAAEESKQSSEGGIDNTIKIPVSVSAAIEEESTTKIVNLSDSEKKSLQEFKQLVQEALKNHEFGTSAEEAVTEERKQSKKTEENRVEAEGKADVAELGGEKNEILVGDGEKISVHDSVDDDGAKTLEAIEETIVAVSSSAPHEQSLSQKGESETAKGDTSETKQSENNEKLPEEVSIWGIKLLEDDRSDVILLKFLRARDFRAKEALIMLKNTIRWRKEFGIDELVEQELAGDGDHGLEKVVFMHGLDKEGHPVCYNVFGEFQSNELYEKSFSDEEKRQRFLRWRIQFLERSIRKLDFNPGGISTIVQVNDLKNSPGPAKKELRLATKQALQLLQDNYPEFVARQIFINVPWWYLAVNRMISPFLTHRTRSKFIFAGPSKSADTLFRYISAEQVPVKYGGMSKGGDFSSADAVTEISVKPAVKHTVEIPVAEKCVGSWEVRVVGWDQVRYGAEFVPAAEGSYTTIIQKPRLVAANEDEIISNSFKIGEPGKLVLTVDNTSSKKKKFLYRFNSKSFSD